MLQLYSSHRKTTVILLFLQLIYDQALGLAFIYFFLSFLAVLPLHFLFVSTNIKAIPPPPSVHILGDFNFCDIVWPDRLSKSGSPLSLSEGKKFIEILNDHHLEQLVHFPTREKNTLDLIITSLPSQFLDIQSPDRLIDHDIVSGTLKIVNPQIKKPRRKVYRYQKGALNL